MTLTLSRRPWKARATEVMWFLVDEDRPFSSNDLRALAGDPDPNGDPNSKNSAIGSLFQKFSADGVIEPVGNVKSTATKRKSGEGRLWQKKKRAHLVRR